MRAMHTHAQGKLDQMESYWIQVSEEGTGPLHLKSSILTV